MKHLIHINYRCRNIRKFRHLLFSKGGGDWQTGRAYGGKQAANEPDQHRENGAQHQQGRRNFEGERHLAETREVQRGRGEAIESQPGQAGDGEQHIGEGDLEAHHHTQNEESGRSGLLPGYVGSVFEVFQPSISSRERASSTSITGIPDTTG